MFLISKIHNRLHASINVKPVFAKIITQNSQLGVHVNNTLPRLSYNIVSVLMYAIIAGVMRTWIVHLVSKEIDGGIGLMQVPRHHHLG